MKLFPPGAIPPQNVITFGSDANCTLAICPISYSVYKYRPALSANITFLTLFSIAMIVHLILGIRWRNYGFMIGMMLGCLIEVGGYAGRIILYNNPWSFGGFMVQIVLITCAPIFYTGSVYVTLSRTIDYLAPELSRFKPSLFYWIFIPADIICLILQAAGGAMSVISSGSSQNGVDISLAGLGLQVAVLVVFSACFIDYMIRYARASHTPPVTQRMRIFLSALSAAIVLILLRCAYRCYELSKGYTHSNLVTDQGLFIGLEGVPIIIAVYLLCIGHPGFVFGQDGGQERVDTISEKCRTASSSDAGTKA